MPRFHLRAQRVSARQLWWATLPWLVASGLLLLPFLWLGPNASLGGDDTRLYYVFPWAWLRNIALPAFGSLSGFGTYQPEQQYLPLTAILGIVQDALPQINTEALAFGVALSSGFLGVYLACRLLMAALGLDWNKRSSFNIAASVIAGLVYVSAPLIGTMYWVTPLSWVMDIGGAPLLFAVALYFLKSGRVSWLLVLGLLDVLFAVGLAAVPVSFPFVSGAILLGVLALILIRTEGKWVGRALMLMLTGLSVNAFWLLPLFLSARTSGSFGNEALATGDAAPTVVTAVARYQSILDTLTLLPSGPFEKAWGWPSFQLWPWAQAFIVPSLAVPATIVIALFFINRPRIATGLIILLLTTLGLAYAQTVNVTNFGVTVFSALSSHVPGFGMFRNFYNKFTAAYVFYYALTFGIAISLLGSRLLPPWSWACLGLLALLVVIQGGPLLLGLPLYLPVQPTQSESKPITQVGQFPASYKQSLKVLSATATQWRVLELPLSANYWSVLPLHPPGALYVGSSPITALTGIGTFNSLSSFSVVGMPELRDRLELAIANQDIATILAVLRLTGVRYIVYSNGLPASAQRHWLQQPAFPSDASAMVSLARSLGATRIATFSEGGDQTQSVYALPEASVLPQLFVSAVVDMPSNNALIDALKPNAASSPLSQDKPPTVAGATSPLTALPQKASSILVANTPDSIAVRRVVHSVPWEYQVDVQVRIPSMLVLLEPFGAQWQATATSQSAHSGGKPLPKVHVDGYASGWWLEQPGDYRIQVAYQPQRYTWIALSISVLALLALTIGFLAQCVMADRSWEIKSASLGGKRSKDRTTDR